MARLAAGGVLSAIFAHPTDKELRRVATGCVWDLFIRKQHVRTCLPLSLLTAHDEPSPSAAESSGALHRSSLQASRGEKH